MSPLKSKLAENQNVIIPTGLIIAKSIKNVKNYVKTKDIPIGSFHLSYENVVDIC